MEGIIQDTFKRGDVIKHKEKLYVVEDFERCPSGDAHRTITRQLNEDGTYSEDNKRFTIVTGSEDDP